MIFSDYILNLSSRFELFKKGKNLKQTKKQMSWRDNKFRDWSLVENLIFLKLCKSTIETQYMLGLLTYSNNARSL